MSCQSSKKSTYAVMIGINLGLIVFLVWLALMDRLDSASFMAILGGVIASNTALFAGTSSSRRCCPFRSKSST